MRRETGLLLIETFDGVFKWPSHNGWPFLYVSHSNSSYQLATSKIQQEDLRESSGLCCKRAINPIFAIMIELLIHKGTITVREFITFTGEPDMWTSKLFEPMTIGDLLFKNRIAMAPMGIVGLTNPDGNPGPRGIDYYVERARGGDPGLGSGLRSQYRNSSIYC